MARMKFLCDAERCIECNACVTACKNEHEVPWGINRRRVVTIQDGKPGERSISVACMHVLMHHVWLFVQLTVFTKLNKV
jgi:formate dehydrogenase iron-sulfur subunit